MVQPLAVATCLKIPSFVVVDSDRNQPDKNGSREKHRKDNEAILKLRGIVDPIPFPSETFWGEFVVMWPDEIAQTIRADVGDADWDNYRAEADKAYGHAGEL